MVKQITFYERVNWLNNPKEIDVIQALKYIWDGSYQMQLQNQGNSYPYTLRQAVEHIRGLPPEQVQEAKLTLLPAVTFSGTFDNHNKLLSYSNVVAVDFDHIGNVSWLKEHLKSFPFVLSIFTTPSGHGVKALVWHDNTEPAFHKELYEALMQEFNVSGADPKCKDITRRTYLSYDPQLYYNGQAEPYHFEHKETIQSAVPNSTQPVSQPQQSIVHDVSDLSVLNLLKSRCKRFHPEYLVEGYRRDGVFWFGTQCGKAGVDYELGLDYVTKLYLSNEIRLISGGKFDSIEIEENYKNGYDKERYDNQFRKKFVIR